MAISAIYTHHPTLICLHPTIAILTFRQFLSVCVINTGNALILWKSDYCIQGWLIHICHHASYNLTSSKSFVTSSSPREFQSVPPLASTDKSMLPRKSLYTLFTSVDSRKHYQKVDLRLNCYTAIVHPNILKGAAWSVSAWLLI